jgi:hypothetical protein
MNLLSQEFEKAQTPEKRAAQELAEQQAKMQAKADADRKEWDTLEAAAKAAAVRSAADFPRTVPPTPPAPKRSHHLKRRLAKTVRKHSDTLELGLGVGTCMLTAAGCGLGTAVMFNLAARSLTTTEGAIVLASVVGFFPGYALGIIPGLNLGGKVQDAFRKYRYKCVRTLASMEPK